MAVLCTDVVMVLLIEKIYELLNILRKNTYISGNIQLSFYVFVTLECINALGLFGFQVCCL